MKGNRTPEEAGMKLSAKPYAPNIFSEIKALVKEFNINSRANKMLYRDEEVANMLKELHNIDRFSFVNKCNKISIKLIPLITPFHNTEVVV